jgi:hypothetical protein
MSLTSLTAVAYRPAEPASGDGSRRWPRSVGGPVLKHCDLLRRLPATRQEREGGRS